MKIALLSDSHGNLAYIKKIGQYLKEKAKVDLIIHLGDEYNDVDILNDLGIDIIKVPGIFSSYYQDPSIPNRIIKEIEGVKVLITHSLDPHPNDLPQDRGPQDIITEENIKAVFYGHTHIAKVEEKKGVMFVNPGHLRESDKRGNPASFAIVEIKSGKICINPIEYGKIIEK